MTQTTDYQKQATDFLERTKTQFYAGFKFHGPYFPDDKENGDVWNITLWNDRHSYTFTFGQSIVNSGGGKKQGKKPTPYDVLASIEKYEVGTFSDFCANYGYDTDSRKAEKLYFAVQEQWENVRRLFTPEQLEELQEIQ